MKGNSERERRIADCQAMVHSLAWQISRRLRVPVEIEDLVGYGQLGLAEAADNYDPARGTKFSSFAYHRIRGAIYDGVSLMTWYRQMPQAEVEQERMANEALADANADGTPPSNTRSDAEWFRDVTGRLATVFILSGGDDDSGGSSFEVSDDSFFNPAASAGRDELGVRLNEIIESLPEDGRELIRLTYFEHMNLQDAARELGVSKSWASRLHTRTLKQLESALRRSGIDGELLERR